MSEETVNLRDGYLGEVMKGTRPGSELLINGARYIVGDDMIARRDHRNRHQRRKDEAERRKKP